MMPCAAPRRACMSYPVRRMLWVGRPAVVVDLEAIAAQFNHALGSVVALGAERLQFAQHELIPILVMLFDVIGDGRWRHQSIGETHLAQRLGSQLQRAAALPVAGAMRMLASGHKNLRGAGGASSLPLTRSFRHICTARMRASLS